MPTYQKRLEQHLTHYRRDRLGVTHCGTFRHRGVDRPYGHILPRDLRWLNIPEPFRAEVRGYVNSEPRIQLHRYFHHLNSSQAFAFSLFYPYLTLAKAELAAALGVASIESWALETIPDPDEGTNVDIFLVGRDEAPIYCEVKLSEAGFGKARPDARHLEKLQNTYRPRLEGRVDPMLLIPEAFCGSYQILRNLWLAAGDARGSALFLVPKENEVLASKLAQVLQLVGTELRARVRILFIEDVLTTLTASGCAGNSLAWYSALLREKYVPQAAV